MEQVTDKLAAIRGCARRLRLSCLTSEASEVLLNAQKETPSYDDFLLSVLRAEVRSRDEKQLLLRYKAARLPLKHSLDEYDPSVSNGLSMTQLRQLRELHWVEEGFNIMLAGPSGVGKTYIAAGLCADAVERGYRAYFRNMDELLSIIKLKDVTVGTRKEYKNLCSSQVIVIDDLMNLTLDREDGNLLFSFITASTSPRRSSSPPTEAPHNGHGLLTTRSLQRPFWTVCSTNASCFSSAGRATGWSTAGQSSHSQMTMNSVQTYDDNIEEK